MITLCPRSINFYRSVNTLKAATNEDGGVVAYGGQLVDVTLDSPWEMSVP